MYFKGFVCHENEGQIVREIEKELKLTDKSSETFVEFLKKEEKGYSIEKSDKIIVSYGDKTDLCRALLKLSSEEEENVCNMSAKKAFSDFGIMLDTSRNAVPKVETVKKMIRLCALMGYKFVGLYMEDTLKIKGEPYWGYQRGAYTKEEIKDMDSYALMFDVELRPFFQTLAHINQVVRYSAYKSIVDAEDIFLVGSERTEEVIEEIIATVSELFTTRKVNIGMDEAFLVGRGKYIDKNGYKARAELMKEHLAMVLGKCKKYGLKPQMWGDMFFDFATPDMLLNAAHTYEVPEDVEICYWDYYSTNPAHYAGRLKAHFNLTKNVAFAGGAWKWSGWAPHNRYSTLANKVAVEECKKTAIDSYTVTCWGDNGAECSMFSVLPTLYATANYVYGDDTKETAFEKMTGVSLEDFLSVDLANPYMEKNGSHNNACKYLLYNDSLLGTFDSVVKEDTVAEFEKAYKKLHEVTTVKGNKYPDLFKTLEKLTCALRVKADLGIRIRKAYEAGDGEALDNIAEKDIPEILECLDETYEAFRKQWYEENKPNGFEIQTIRFGGLKQRLIDTIRIIKDYVDGKADSIDIIEEEQLDFAYYEYDDISDLNHNVWSDMVSPAVMG